MEEVFEAVLKGLSVYKVSEQHISLMYQHWLLVHAWNLRTNLTAVRTTEEAVWVHYYDSLQALAVCDEDVLSVVDIGSGGGFPGIPLAICRPRWNVTLLEPRRKRVSFLHAAVARLALPNVTVVEGRVEDEPSVLFDMGVSRATFSQQSDLDMCMRWVRKGGRFVAYQSEEQADCSGDVLHRYGVKNSRRALVSWISAG